MPEQPEVILRVEGLSKTFIHKQRSGPLTRSTERNVEAVSDVSFQLRRGDCMGIVGESGSGKTTIARMLMGLESPTSGTMTLDGVDLAEVGAGGSGRRARARLIQMVFQDPYTSLDPRQSVAAGLDEIQRLHFERSDEERRARTAELLLAVGLAERHGASVPRQLSGGQRQRVAIARALATEPDLLVLDEPVSALDVSVQAQILNLLSDLRSKFNLTAIMISHDLAVIRQVSEFCLVMYRGRVVERANTAVVLAAPAHPYTRRLIQSAPRRDMVLEAAPRVSAAVREEGGCPFVSCRDRAPRCREDPPDVLLAPGYVVRCWLAVGTRTPSASDDEV